MHVSTSILIVLLILLIIIVSRYHIVMVHNRNSLYRIPEIYHPGDIIISEIQYRKPITRFAFNYAYPLITGDLGSHISVVVQDPVSNMLYVWDNYPVPRYDDYFKVVKTGPALMKISKFFDFYKQAKTRVISSIGNLCSPNGIQSGWQYITNGHTSGVEFDTSVWRLVNTILKIPVPLSNNIRTSEKNRVLCSESVAELLTRYGLRITEPSTATPHDIARAAKTSGLYFDNLMI